MFGRTYANVCWVEVSEKNLKANYEYLSRLAPQLAIAPVVKSNAYGHGLVLAAKIFAKFNPPFLCVDSLYEAYELSKAGIATPILVMGYVGEENLAAKKLPFSFCAYDLEQLSMIRKLQPQAGVHVFVDTGMHREGLTLGELQKVRVPIEGLMSHLAQPLEPSKRETREQIKSFAMAREILAVNGMNPKWVHLEASGAILRAREYGGIGNMARVGKALYLTKPAFQFFAKVAQVKGIKKGEKVGYDFTFTAKRDGKLAILPVGYNDGVDRRLSNKGWVEVRGVMCPIVGRVSMNITTIDVSEVPGVKSGDVVTVFSNDSAKLNSVAAVAKLCDTLPHDIMVHVGESIKRVIV